MNVEPDGRTHRSVRRPRPDEDVARPDREAEGRQIRVKGRVRRVVRGEHEAPALRDRAAPCPVGRDGRGEKGRANQDQRGDLRCAALNPLPSGRYGRSR